MSEERPATMRALEGPAPPLEGSPSLYRLLQYCDRLELNVQLTEYDKPGVTEASWPAVVINKIKEGEAAYFARNPGRKIVCVTTAVHDGRCVKILHIGGAK